jgi:crotonobetainyl-CoA:carnitine CoA-transferase CaiB-like acyl-CoA transferase
VRLRTVAPKLGRHNVKIFDRVGVTSADIEQFRAKGVV